MSLNKTNGYSILSGAIGNSYGDNYMANASEAGPRLPFQGSSKSRDFNRHGAGPAPMLAPYQMSIVLLRPSLWFECCIQRCAYVTVWVQIYLVVAVSVERIRRRLIQYA